VGVEITQWRGGGGQSIVGMSERDRSPTRKEARETTVRNTFLRPTTVLIVSFDKIQRTYLIRPENWLSRYHELFKFWTTLSTIIPAFRSPADPGTPDEMEGLEIRCLLKLIGDEEEDERWSKKYGVESECLYIDSRCEIFKLSAHGISGLFE
jgi:hypothetical protein